VAVALVVAAAIAASAVAAVGAARAARAEPPSALFRNGYNLCRSSSLSAIRKAGGQPYKRGLFANWACTWLTDDLQAGILLSTHPSSFGASLMRGFLAQNGTQGLKARRIRVPGASTAVLVTLRASAPDQVAKDLFAAYKRGVIQINMTAPRSLPEARLLAVLKVVAGS
jgi:hypothetical protein